MFTQYTNFWTIYSEKIRNQFSWILSKFLFLLNRSAWWWKQKIFWSFPFEMQSWSDKMKLPLYKSKRRVLIKWHGVGHIQCFQLFYLTIDHGHDWHHYILDISPWHASAWDMPHYDIPQSKIPQHDMLHLVSLHMTCRREVGKTGWITLWKRWKLQSLQFRGFLCSIDCILLQHTRLLSWYQIALHRYQQ